MNGDINTKKEALNILNNSFIQAEKVPENNTSKKILNLENYKLIVLYIIL